MSILVLHCANQDIALLTSCNQITFRLLVPWFVNIKLYLAYKLLIKHKFAVLVSLFIKPFQNCAALVTDKQVKFSWDQPMMSEMSTLTKLTVYTSLRFLRVPCFSFVM